MKTKTMIFGLSVIALMILSVFLVAAAPSGPTTINTVSSERRVASSTSEVNAYAGNVTELTISGVSVTQAWQGYYGNVSGQITLDDASNNTMYNWSLANPEGEVYAANATIADWTTVYCVNSTSTVNTTAIENWLNIDSTDADGVDETFNETYVDGTGFYAGTVQINTDDKCVQANTFVDQAYQTSNFKEVILADTAGSIIWTALIENSVDGFKTGTDNHDFQMLVGEDGHDGDVSATPYYFYIELE